MSKKKKGKNLKVVDFQAAKSEAEKIPDFFIERLEVLLEKAKEGKLRTLITHFDYGDESEDETGEIIGGTLLWNHTHNAAELVGIIEIIKTLALDNAMGE